MIEAYRDCMAIRNYQPAALKKNLLIANKFMAWIEDIHTIDTVTVEDYLIHLLRTGRTIKTTKPRTTYLQSKAFVTSFAISGSSLTTQHMALRHLMQMLPHEHQCFVNIIKLNRVHLGLVK